jgi:predicted dehydrogenase
MFHTAGSEEPLKAVIIGCGAIAGGYDESYLGPDILTHAKAYRKHAGFRLVACVEPNEKRRRQFMQAWGIEDGFSDIDELLSIDYDFDIASVCAPTSEHANILRKLLSTPIKGVFCEKPISDNFATSKLLVDLYAQAGVPFAVNYFRRWDESLQSLKEAIEKGKWGALQTAACHYGKGIRHNGSHMIDLLQFLLGDLTPVLVSRQQRDFQDADPTLDAILNTQGNVPIHLIGTDSHLFDVFEACLTFENGQISLEQGGEIVRERQVEPDHRFSGHRSLSTGAFRSSSLGDALYRALANLYKAVKESGPLVSNSRTALAAEEVCDHLLQMSTRA